MVPAVEKILDQFHERFGCCPKVVQFDEGKEFYNNGVKGLLEKHDIHYFSTRLTGKKAAVVERFNRTLKTRMWKYFTEQQFTTKSKKWIDVLDNFVASYNHSKHRTIDMKPADVNETNKDKVWTKLYGYPLSHFSEPKFKVGDRVRDQIYRDTFVKGYTSNYTDDVYVVSEVFRGDPNMYKLIDPDDDDREIKGRFYEHELSLDLSDFGDDLRETTLDDLDRRNDEVWLSDFKRQNEGEMNIEKKKPIPCTRLDLLSEARELVGITVPKGEPDERIKYLKVERQKLKIDFDTESDPERKDIFREALEIIDQNIDDARLEMRERPESEEGVHRVREKVREDVRTRFEKFKIWARENLGVLSAIAISIAGIITTVAGKKMLVGAAKGVGEVGKALGKIAKAALPVIVPILNMLATILKWGAKGIEFLAKNLWILAILIAGYLYNYFTKRNK
ncbi:integrase core domain-containing [Paramuricea clavata]|uniref:Integrase core domain-containing n=1 Tax=Paramuricea clavata TaxID=317549 RepID=A0A6S7GYS2_PARCT|nr:integrase core domain-containing [Paramuricea clavata]